MEIRVRYHIEAHLEAVDQVIQCESLEQAEKKLRSLRSSEVESYLYKTVIKDKTNKEEVFLVL